MEPSKWFMIFSRGQQRKESMEQKYQYGQSSEKKLHPKNESMEQNNQYGQSFEEKNSTH